MPIETVDAINWALQQSIEIDGVSVPVTKDNPGFLVDKVRQYFNMNGIEYETFSYDDFGFGIIL